MLLAGCGSELFGTKPEGTVAQMCESLPPISLKKAEIAGLSAVSKKSVADDTTKKETWCGSREVYREAKPAPTEAPGKPVS